MSKLKKVRNIVISSLLSLVLVGFAALLPYYQVKAEVITATLGVATVGSALITLLALSGVGMELENNRKFNELTDEEKDRIQNGLAQNYEDVALQHGASLEKIKSWTSDLCNGVLDKASECWDIFKSWAKNITLTENSFDSSLVNGQPMSPDELLGMSWNGIDRIKTMNARGVEQIKTAFGVKENDSRYIGWIVYSSSTSWDGNVTFVTAILNTNSDVVDSNTTTITYRFGSEFPDGTWSQSYGQGVVGTRPKTADIVICSKPVVIDGVDYNGKGSSVTNIFSTNTDYLERLKGQDTDTVDVIDVTDIKHPIIESVPNTKAELSYNKGFKRPTPEDNDDNVVVGGLVPTNVFYESLDDYNEGLKNEIIEYDQNIQENPENQDKIFVSPTPIINVHNIYNTLPVVNTPINNTVVNNNYTYNNTYNKNVTINELPYNAELIPYLPTMLFENKFPFCIPFDIYTLFSVFYVEREAPVFTFDVPFPSENGLEVQQITLGLQDFEYCALVLRIMWYFLFLLGLMLISRKLIKG